MAGLTDKIRNDVKRAGTNKSKFIYFRPDQKQRVRFLVDADDGMEIVFHDSFERGINVPCQETFGRSCPYCEDDGIRTRSQYAWSVYNYETKEVQVFMFPVNNCSPISALMAMYDTYGTLLDRDYVISVSGKGPDKSYSVVPMDKVKFRNTKAKPFSNSKILEMLDKAFPCDDVEEDEEEAPRHSKSASKSKSKSSAKASSKKKVDDDDWKDEDGGLPDADELEEMSSRELYNLCKERDIECKPKKRSDYYIELLEEWREEHQDDYDAEDEDEEDDWEDEEDDDQEPIDYSELTPQELYKLCKERKLDVVPKKSAKYYIKQLEDYDNAQDDWGDGDDEDDWGDDDE